MTTTLPDLPKQRHTRRDPCPICGGGDDDPRGRGMRCDGFTSSDGRYAHCSREEYAGALNTDPNGRTYPHRLDGPCACGVAHLASAPARPNPERSDAWARPTRSPRPNRTARPMRYEALPNKLTLGGVVFGCTAIYPYRTVAGEEPWAFEVRRFDWYDWSAMASDLADTPDHLKTYRPYSRRADGLWVSAQVGAWPLYHYPELLAAPAPSPVLLVEGEKCANVAQTALQAVGLPWAVVTTPGGEVMARALPPAMFAPLAGRCVVIVPDADAAGARYAAAIARHVRTAGAARVAILRLAGLTGKEDIAEWLVQWQPGQDRQAGHDGD